MTSTQQSPADQPRSRWTLSEVAAALGVGPRRMLTDWQAHGVSIDSRTLQPGEIFVCVRGDRTDGHEYISRALAAGAVGLVIEEQAALVHDLGLPHPTEPIAVFVVEDGLRALQELASYHRQRMTGKIFGITGSNGKTSAKEMLAGLLAALPAPPELRGDDPRNATALIGESNVAATRGNLNNHFGVPLTLLSMPADIPYAVIEMGMNHAGEIEVLSRLARPHAALITSIAPVHVENFPGPASAGGGLTGIAHAKLEIVAGLPQGGPLVYPAVAFGQELADAAATRAGAALIRFAVGPVQHDAGLRFDWRGRPVHAPAYHNPVMASNLIGCLELLAAAGFSETDLRAAVPRIAPRTTRRFEIVEKARPDNRPPQLLIDDSYNANPTSFGRALEALRSLLPDGRLACFAGEMGELGPEYGPAGHREVGGIAATEGYEFVGVCGGKSAEALKDTFAEKSAGAGGTSYHATVDDLLAALNQNGLNELARYDGILVKGSRSARMDVLCDALRKHSYI